MGEADRLQEVIRMLSPYYPDIRDPALPYVDPHPAQGYPGAWKFPAAAHVQLYKIYRLHLLYTV